MVAFVVRKIPQLWLSHLSAGNSIFFFLLIVVVLFGLYLTDLWYEFFCGMFPQNLHLFLMSWLAYFTFYRRSLGHRLSLFFQNYNLLSSLFLKSSAGYSTRQKSGSIKVANHALLTQHKNDDNSQSIAATTSSLPQENCFHHPNPLLIETSARST